MALRQCASRLLPLGAAAGAVYFASQQAQLAPPFASFAAQADAAGPALDPNEWRPLRLAGKKQLTHNSFELSFALPEPQQEAGLTVASCLLVKAPLQGPGDDKPKVIIRPYTPTSPPDAKGHLDLVIKAYPDGKMSKHLGSMKVGDTLDFKGPLVKFPYKRNDLKEIGMVAGGTGITPMLQVAEWILRDPTDKTKVSLLFANVSEGDILCKKRIDELAAAHPDRFKVHYVVDKASWGGLLWKGSTGYVTPDLLKAHLPPPGVGNMVFVCGPPGMMNAVSGDKAPDKSQGPLSGALRDLGYSPEGVYKF
ncbi:NADH-cytochrome b5 reductase [Raphidocelis subcapitata]|uniref:cytochrome-b5 reductase n=1 Tax=Raphidocelis subcapitata TaxID=307507 RepID=A0A2V0PJT8_9CHLO|nr:NADH-cytochrome b5 reductase [Raphidocelis subcapitata]|eukprot:GBF97577.1 NADH-cytochrome b5 reductase [Raphidocelis subcapitata]